MRHVALTVNGTRHELELEPRELLVYVLRERLGLTGTNVGCDTSSCGACTVLVDGESVKSCTDARRPGRRRGDHDDRGARDERRAAPGAAGVPRPPRPPVRLLHAGHGDGGRLADRARGGDERGGDPRGARGQPLPLHRLPQHRRRRAGRGDRRGGRHERHRGRAAYVGAPVKRREDEALLTGRGTYVDNMALAGNGLDGRRPQPVRARARDAHRPRRGPHRPTASSRRSPLPTSPTTGRRRCRAPGPSPRT